MKTLIKKTFALSLAFICLVITIPASAVSVDSLKAKHIENELGLTTVEFDEVVSMLDEEFTATDDTITYEIYNDKDELISTKTIKSGDEINDKEFIQLKAKSDFFMEIDNVSVYRLQKH